MPISLHGWQLNPISLSPLTCLVPWRVQIELQRAPKGSKKGPQNNRKSIKNPLGQPLACPGVPGDTPQVPPNAYVCVFMHMLCIFMHMYANLYLCVCERERERARVSMVAISLTSNMNEQIQRRHSQVHHCLPMLRALQ